ncbi:MAG TPA: hypothetical protein VHM26_13525 [Chitinophagaceae bacterium]|jgi:hypothetical protein|nr:hypothetical protein [Chitinophagaceae bacterium]
MKKGIILLLLLALRLFSYSQYKGGSNDGFARLPVINQNPLPSIYAGGNNDGYHQQISLNQNGLPNIYTGNYVLRKP